MDDRGGLRGPKRACFAVSVVLACGVLACGAVAPGPSAPSRAGAVVEVGACDASAPAVTHGPIPFGIYSPNVADFAALAADGFTMVGPWYQPPPDRALLDAAHANGLGVLFPVGYDNQRYHQADETITWDEPTLRREIAATIEAVADHPSIVAWYLMPEELRYWRPDELEYQAIAREVIRSTDPLQRPIVGYQPNDRDAEQLAKSMVSYDIAAKGTYVGYSGHAHRRAWVAWSTTALATAAAQRPAWVLPEMFEDPPAATIDDIAAWARHDVMLGLLSGADGVLVYSGWRRPGFGAFDAYRSAYGAIARELNGHGGIAAVMMSPHCRAHTLTIERGPLEVVFTAAKRTERWPSVAMFEMIDDGDRWVWLVNSASEAVLVSVAPGFAGEIVSGAGSAVVAPSDGDATQLWLSPWAVVGAVQRAGHPSSQQVGHSASQEVRQ